MKILWYFIYRMYPNCQLISNRNKIVLSYYEFYVVRARKKLNISHKFLIEEGILSDSSFDYTAADKTSWSKIDVLWLDIKLSVNWTCPVTLFIQGAYIRLGMHVWAVSPYIKA